MTMTMTAGIYCIYLKARVLSILLAIFQSKNMLHHFSMRDIIKSVNILKPSPLRYFHLKSFLDPI